MQEELLQFRLQKMDVKSAFLYGRIKEEVYVDDIIFGSTKKKLCNEFERLMKDIFHMSSIGELTFFLGFQVKQKEDGIFISQDKYVTEVLRKFNLSDAKTASTPVDTEKPLVKDADGDDIDVHLYRSMIRSLMYLTASRPDIMYVVCGEGSTVPVESHHTPSGAPTTSQPPFSSPSRIPTRQETEVPQPSSPTHTHVADEVASTGVDVRHEGPATTVTSLDAGQGSGKTPSMPYDLPLPRVNTLGSDEGSMTLQELTILCTTLSQKVESFEANLKQTKQVYEAAYTKLIMKVERLEKTVKTSKARRQERYTQGEAHSQPKDQLRVLSAAKVLADAAKVHTYTRRRRAVNTASDGISTASRIVSTTGTSMPVSTASMIDKEAGSSKRDVEEELEHEGSKKQKTSEALGLAQEQPDNRQYWKIIIVGNHTKVYQFFDDMLKVFDRDDLVMLWYLVKERFNSTEPTDDKERVLWVELKRLFKPDTNDELWESHKYMFDITWRLYDTCGIHHVSTKEGMNIYMLVENEYPLSKGILTQMLCVKLMVEEDRKM
nr:uncharacterized mitochondrial protein AtMg00810-like [Tanacetum cinerariifolium]